MTRWAGWIAALAALAACGGEPDGACDPAVGCGEGEYCDLQFDFASALRGDVGYRCKARFALGAACLQPADHDANSCADGAYCGHDTNTAAGTCRPRVSDGATCPGDDDGPFVCSSGRMCVAGDDGSRSCLPGGGKGAACFLASTCQVGLFCDDATGTCAPRRAEGGECTPDASICTGPETASDRCVRFSAQCAAGLTCHRTADAECFDRLDCEGQDRCCVTEAGAACVADDTPDCQEPTGTCGP